MRVQLDRQIFNSALHISDFDLQSNLYCTCSSNLSFNPRANGRKPGARVTNFVLAEFKVVARDR